MSSLEQTISKISKSLFSKDSWHTLAKYLGLSKAASNLPITDPERFSLFIKSRSSHVAQTALFGYLKTRAGTRFPEMFRNPDLLRSMNMAKWQIWLACLSDLSVYMGGLIHQRSDISNQNISALLAHASNKMFDEVGQPDDADDSFSDSVEGVRQRIANIDFSMVSDDEFAFSTSPAALYTWSPIADELKCTDKEIVENSIRFRWQEVRRSARKLLQSDELIAAFFNATQTKTKTD